MDLYLYFQATQCCLTKAAETYLEQRDLASYKIAQLLTVKQLGDLATFFKWVFAYFCMQAFFYLIRFFFFINHEFSQAN